MAEKFLAIKRRHGGESILYYGGGAGQPPRRRLRRQHAEGPRGEVPLQRPGPRKDRRVLGPGQDVRYRRARRLRALRGGHPDRQESLAIPWFRPRPRAAQRHGRGPRTLDHRDRPAPEQKPPPWPTSTCRSVRAPTPGAWRRWSGSSSRTGALARDWLAEHTSGYEHIVDELNAIPVAYCAETCGVAEDKLARRRPADRQRQQRIGAGRPGHADEPCTRPSAATCNAWSGCSPAITGAPAPATPSCPSSRCPRRARAIPRWARRARHASRSAARWPMPRSSSA
ncbi:hypothetical protein ACPA9J_01040 [Pseudomonas aeruginosa]